MERSELDFEGPMDEPQHNVAWPDSPEERVDRFGIVTAAVLLCIAFFIAALWLRLPSFQKCSALDNVAERNACYDTLRIELSKPPAKGPDISQGLNAR